MVWSVSNAKAFERCQRQWFYQNKVASARAKCRLRRRAHRLSKLQSVSGWRGSVVDQVLSDDVVPAIAQGRSVSKDKAISLAMKRFDRQLDIAREHRMGGPEFKPANNGEDLTVFHCLEYSGTVEADEIRRARDEVVGAIANLFSMEDLIARLETASRLITQRSLSFNHSDVTVRAVPDLIAFFGSEPPTIVDWKVHAFGWRDAWFQLAVYAAALTRCNPHKDFPMAKSQFREHEIKLLEVQLLQGMVRTHEFNSEHFRRMDAYIAMSAESMMLAVSADDDSTVAMDPSLYPVTRYSGVCDRCPYRSLCWEPSL